MNVSAPLLSALMNSASSICCHTAGRHDVRPTMQLGSTVVPWLDAAIPITSSTFDRVSGQKRRAHRIDIPPWLWPSTAMSRVDFARIVRIA